MFDQIYSVEWQAVTLLMGVGTCFLLLVAMTAIFGFFVVKLFNKVVVVLTFLFQLSGGKQFTELFLTMNYGVSRFQVLKFTNIFPS